MGARIHYAELRGEGAQAALLDFLRRLPGLSGFLGGELLSSPEQPGLYLVASRWAGEVPELDPPPGARSWSFSVEASAP